MKNISEEIYFQKKIRNKTKKMFNIFGRAQMFPPVGPKGPTVAAEGSSPRKKPPVGWLFV